MKSQKTPYEKQIFVCVNDKKGEKPSCGDHKGEEIFRKLREIAKERGLHPKDPCLSDQMPWSMQLRDEHYDLSG